MPDWLKGDVIDVRKEVIFWSEGRPSGFHRTPRVNEAAFLTQINLDNNF